MDRASRSRFKNVMSYLKSICACLLILFLALVLVLLLYKLYRWVTEAPIVMEKKVEVEKIIEKIPDECTQIRRHGKIQINCDGVKINGSPTIGASGVERVPDFVTD